MQQPAPLSTSSFNSTKYAAIVIDGSNGSVLYETAAEAPRFPASLTKMMTLYLLFEAMESGRVSRTTLIPVSDYARSRPPTKIGFKRGDSVDVETAILAVVTRSANDVAIIAENLGGSEANFAAMKTARGAIGMRSTTFRNASGLPDPNQWTTARDMATLSLRIARFPEYYPYFRIMSFTWKGRSSGPTISSSANSPASTASRPATSARRASMSSPRCRAATVSWWPS